MVNKSFPETFHWFATNIYPISGHQSRLNLLKIIGYMIILLDQTIKYGVQANFMKISERNKKYLTNSISQFSFLYWV